VRNLSRQEVILPRKTVLELAKLLAENDDPVAIELSASQASFKFGDVLLVSKLVDGKFPDYTRVVPHDQPRRLRLDRSQLLQSLQRAAILTSDKFRGVRWVLSDGTLKIICSNTEQEEAQEELDVDYKGVAGYRFQRRLPARRAQQRGRKEVDCALTAIQIPARSLPFLDATISSTSSCRCGFKTETK
jgi:DNA polymerase III sliding clamp (beta) subunit (PCNA family)